MNRFIKCSSVRSSTTKSALVPGSSKMNWPRQFGVSGTTVREALTKLEQDGLVVKSPHRFTMVPRLSQQDIEEIYDLRLALETLAVRRVHERITPEGLARLKELLTKGGEALEQGDLNGLVHYNEEFHNAV